MVKSIIITQRSYYSYQLQAGSDVDTFVTALKSGEDIWYEFQDGARKGSIGKVQVDGKWDTDYGLYLPNSIVVNLSDEKTQKVAIKSYHNNHKFLIGYTGTYVNQFQKGQAKAKPTETRMPDMLGNRIKVGDWVIFTEHGRYASGKPALGRLHRLSDAGSAWVMAPNKQGDEVEKRTDGASSLIKVNMTPELHSTVMLCDSIQNVRTKLVIDLDHDAYQ